MRLLFVYGTLMRSGSNHSVLERLGARFVGRATTSEPRTLVDLGPYPALLRASRARDEGSDCVHGEVFELSDSAFDAVDAFEGPELYARESVSITMETGTEASAFVYVLAASDGHCAAAYTK